ncbi:MAG: hypothetical protein WBG48_18170 [Pricia sp.]
MKYYWPLNLIMFLFGLLFSGLMWSCQEKSFSIRIDNSIDLPEVEHGLQKLNIFAKTSQISVTESDAVIHLKTAIDSVNLVPEAYTIYDEGDAVRLSGGDAVGLMYALLDVKEQLANGQRTITEKSETPHLTFRALKFNLPWDAYRGSASLAQHTETVKDTVFWQSFLDMMAENRFNKLTLWNLHPFNYMVKLDTYPEANTFTEKEMAEWESFWHSLFKMAKNRGIETYIVNWNIFVPRSFAEHHGVSEISQGEKKHLGKGDTSQIVKDYTRESVTEVINTYPDLTGLGITLGEGMGEMTAEEREEWLLETVVEGARQAERKIKFIHRVPLSATEQPAGSTSASLEQMTRRTLDTLTAFKGPINIELKFNWSHAHSTPSLVKVHGGPLTDAYWNPMPENYRLAWMMRNEDFFILRWGQTPFIRRHIEQNVHPYVNGYYVGSETYIPAKDYITALDGASYNYAFERQWMFYKAWGRLLYNPETPDSYFEDAFEKRFPEHGKILFEAQQKVSQVPLIIASYWDARWDFTLYSEGMIGFNNGPPAVKLLSLETLAGKKPMDPSYIGIPDYLDSGKKTVEGKITPVQLSDSLASFCATALEEVENIDSAGNTDLLYEKSDIQAWSHLGLYFSNKLKAATAYREYLNTKDKKHLESAISWLEKATDNWENLVKVTEPVYEPVPIEAKGFRADSKLFHWSIVQEEVEAELEWLKSLNVQNQ